MKRLKPLARMFAEIACILTGGMYLWQFIAFLVTEPEDLLNAIGFLLIAITAWGGIRLAIYYSEKLRKLTNNTPPKKKEPVNATKPNR